MTLEGWWPLHEDSGQANDLSGNGNHGTVNGATQGVAGRGGLQAYSFDGTDDEVDLGSYTPITSPPLTLSAWFNPSTLPSVNGESGKIAGDKDYEYEIVVSDDDDGIDYRIRDGTGFNVIEGTVVSTDTWHHAVLTYKPDGTAVGYLNGAVDGTATYDGTLDGSTTGLWQIGKRGSTNHFAGQICDVRVYNRALTL